MDNLWRCLKSRLLKFKSKFTWKIKGRKYHMAPGNPTVLSVPYREGMGLLFCVTFGVHVGTMGDRCPTTEAGLVLSLL